MANYKNTNYYFIDNVKQTVPESADKTGTISTDGNKVIGVGTSFTTDMPSGSWLTDLSNDEIRLIISVDSDTQATMQQAFSSDLMALTTPNVIGKNQLGIVEISVLIPAAQPNGQIDGQTLVSGIGVSFSKASRERSSNRDLVDPIIVDATGTTMEIIVIK